MEPTARRRYNAELTTLETSHVKSDSGVYLRSDVKVEPLSCGWYAWGHLISPLQHALNIALRQLPLLKSYLANPSIHAAASRDPALLSAPFVQLSKDDAPAANRLLADTLERCGPLLGLAEDWLRLERHVQASASGSSLEDLYDSIPDSLRGLVELTYDLRNHACLRFFEEMIGQGEFDGANTQEVAFFATKDRDRNFFLNTPRLPSNERLIVPLAFADRQMDRIAQSRLQPASAAKLAEDLGLSDRQREAFYRFFSESPPQRLEPDYEGEHVRIRYFGHACVLLQTSKISILVDPVVAFGREEPEASLCFDDLPDSIDFVFLTHNHQDHFCPEVLLQLRGRIRRILVPPNNSENIADPSIALALRRLGFDNVTVMAPFDRLKIEGGEIVSLPSYGEHADLSIHSKQGLYVRANGRTLAFLADANCLDRGLYRRVARMLGKTDVLFIGMECDGAPMSWLYGPYCAVPIKRRDDESRRLSGSNSERAWAVVEELGCRDVFVYAMGQEPWLKHLCGLQYTPESKQIIESDKLIAHCRSENIRAERLYGCREMIVRPTTGGETAPICVSAGSGS